MVWRHRCSRSTAETLIEVDFVKDDAPSTKMFAVNVRYEERVRALSSSKTKLIIPLLRLGVQFLKVP